MQEERAAYGLSTKSLREALKAWNQTDVLGQLPLAKTPLVLSHREGNGYGDSASGRGIALRELLGAAMESISPERINGKPIADGYWDLADRRWRPYFILRERFIKGRSLDWIAAQLHVSQRTCQYEQTRALELVADRLYEWAIQVNDQAIHHEDGSTDSKKEPASIGEITKKQSAGSQVARSGSPTIFFVPPRPPYPLIGRSDLLGELRQRFIVEKDNTLLALHGLPGVGKSALTIELVHDADVIGHYTGGVLWIGLGPTPDVAALLGILGKVLGVSANELAAKPSAADRARMVQGTIGLKRFLLVIDDAWSTEVAWSFKVGGPNCSYLLTTRFPDVAFDFAGTDTHLVNELEYEYGFALLETLAPDAVVADQATVQSLVGAVGGLPLALTLMGKHLGRVAHKAQPRRLRDALAKLQTVEGRLKLSDANSLPIQATPVPLETPRSLYAAIELTVAALGADSQQALRVLALFPPKPNTFSEAAALGAASISVDVLDLLVDVALVESVGKERYTLHQTIADYARLTDQGETDCYSFVRYFLSFIDEKQQDYKLLEKELDNVLAALDLAYSTQMGHAAVMGTLNLLSFLESYGYLALAQTYLTRATEVVESLDAPQLWMKVTGQLGNILNHLGRYQEAQALLCQSLTFARHGPSQRALADTHLALGTIDYRLGTMGESRNHLMKALDLFRTDREVDGEIKTLIELGTLLLRQSRYQHAEAYFREAQEIAMRVGNRRHMMAALSGLGEAAKNQANFKAARAHQEEALSICRKLDNRFAEGKILHGLANVLLSLGDSEAAEKRYLQALHLFQTMGARTDESSTLNNLGLIGMNLGQYDKAVSYFIQAISINEETGSQYGKGIALHNLGRVYLLQGQYMRATAYYQQALEIAQRIKDQDGEARTLRNLGLMQLYCGNYACALTYFTQSLAIVNEINNPLGETRTLCYLGLHAFTVANIEEAFIYAKKALSIANEAGYPTEKGDAMMLLAHALGATEQMKEAATAYQSAFEIRCQLGEDHLAIESLAGLASVNLTVGQDALAKQSVDKICAYLEKDPTLAGTVAPFHIYWVCYQVLQTTDQSAAIGLLTSAYKLLMERANQFTPAQRKTYLQSIDVHHRLLLEVSHLGIES
ncbi:MAG: tetratricopeptide repeat protein [Chloroflexota bacterium]